MSPVHEALLSCPQLVGLEYAVVDSNNADSELKQLLDLLQAGAHCRALRIDTRKAGESNNNSSWNSLKFALPSLEDIAIISKGNNTRNYNPFPLICSLMGSQNLKRLDVPFWSYSFPRCHDFRNLRYLRTSITACDPHDVSSLCFFLESDTIKLHGLFIGDMSLETSLKTSSQLWPAIQKQQHSLRELTLPMSQGNRSKHYYRKYLDIDYMVAISETFTALERLGLDIPLTPEEVSSDYEIQVRIIYCKVPLSDDSHSLTRYTSHNSRR